MVSVSLSKVSSKGQIVIPKEFRDKFREGSEVLFIEERGILILKPVENLYKNFREDILFAKETEEAYEKISRGEREEKDFDEFIEDLISLKNNRRIKK